MEHKAHVKGLSFEPEKVHDFDEWIADVKLEIFGDSGDNAIAFDWFGQTREVSSAKEFVENTLKALALTQCKNYKNRLCWGATFLVNSEVLDEQLTPEKVDEAFTCYGEQLVLGVINAKKTDPDWLAEGTISITSYVFRMAKNENSFLDESGAMWNGDTIGVSCTAVVDGSETIPDVLLCTPGTALLSKFIRGIIVTNVGVTLSDAALFKVLYLMSEQTTIMSSTLSAFMQVWNMSFEQLVDDADKVWEWVQSCFTGRELELAQNVANALFALPFRVRDGTKSLCAKRRSLPIALFGFHHLSEADGWKYVQRHFWLSIRTIGLDVEQSAKTFHFDVLYRMLIEEGLILDGAEEEDVGVLKEFVCDLEEKGDLDPLPKRFVEHLAGESLTRDTLQEDTRVAQMRLEARASSTIELTTATTFAVRVNGRRARLAIENGSELVVRGKDVAKIGRDLVNRLQGMSFMGFGATWAGSSSENRNLKGSMVANVVMQGEYGAGAGLWLLSHILYGDVKVSNESENGLMQSVASDSTGLRINVPIDAGIAASIHAATDGEGVFLCLSRSHVFRLRRAEGLLKARRSRVDVRRMKGCSLAPRRAVS
ncbi:unnamed protein product [Agarophyton chilense]